MPACYLVAQLDVRDLDAYEQYRPLAAASIEKHGGEYLVRGGEVTLVEGEGPMPRVVILKFPSKEKALAWYRSDDYAKALRIRLKAAASRSFLVEGN